MCEVDWNLLLEYLRVFLSWPTITLVIVLVVFYLFKADITQLIARLSKGQIYGMSFEIQPQKTETSAEALKDISSGTEMEQWVRDHPAQAIAEYQKAYNSFQWERVLNLIYGTQIDLLVHLSNLGDAGDKYTNLYRFHAQHQSLAKSTKYPFADYILFLKQTNLIRLDEPTGSVSITPFGIAFIDHIRAWYPNTWSTMRGL